MNNKIIFVYELFRSLHLCWRALKVEVHNIKDLIFYSEAIAMFMNIIKAIGAMSRAIIYYFILFTGMTLTGLGTYIVLFTTFRFAQLLWVLIFKESWL